ncbi:hypothetical protein MHN02_20525 [Alteromonas sp. CNT1-28]|jgi:hypothetical protein|nr:hypothetical protein [Alteromonas sp. CNT1-28]
MLDNWGDMGRLLCFMISGNSFQKTFNEIVDKNLEDASSESIKTLALAIWYENFIPDVSLVCDPQHTQRAGYLLERLLAFHCVAPVVRENLREAVHQLEIMVSKRLEMPPLSSVINNNRLPGDPLAKRWGLQESLKTHIQSLLPYQTRHYIHTSKEWK